VKKARHEESSPPIAWASLPRGLVFLAVLGVVGTLAAAALIWLSSEGDETFSRVPAADPGPVHVHGLGINPADEALFIATHTGL
jgi:hypothetical protein